MKRYLLFAGDYPLGGAEDLVGSYETLDQAMNALPDDGPNWAHIYRLVLYESASEGLVADWDKFGGWRHLPAP